MTTIKIKKKKGQVTPERRRPAEDGHKWSPVNRNLKPNEDIIRMQVGDRWVYGVVTGGFGCSLHGMGRAIFVERTENLDDVITIRDERMVNFGRCDFRALPPDRMRSERWESYYDLEVMTE